MHLEQHWVSLPEAWGIMGVSEMSLRFTQFGIPSHLVASWGAQQGAGPDIERARSGIVDVCRYRMVSWRAHCLGWESEIGGALFEALEARKA
jgi:hypothetical protein